MRLRRQLGVRRVGGGLSLAGGSQRRTGRGAGLLRGNKGVACRPQNSFGGGLFRACGLECRGIDGPCADLIALRANLRELLIQSPPALLGFTELPCHGLSASIRLGRGLRGAIGLGLCHADRFSGFGEFRFSD